MKIRNDIVIGALAALFIAALSPQAFPQGPAAPPAAKSSVKQRAFATPDEAARALVEAARAKNPGDLLAVVGPGAGAWLFSGDRDADANDWARFVAAYDEKRALEAKGDRLAVLQVGPDDWPFPAPLVKRGATWSFDASAGREEILNRRVGRNELDAVQTILAIVDAQREYAATDADGNGFADYARRFRSTPGRKDGLYWPTQAGEAESPLGPLVAVAAREGYGKQADAAKPSAYHGYYYKILESQGAHAHGGAYDYRVGDKLLGGFAVVAWPATYGVSGVTTFLVNHEGVVYEKDIGAGTPTLAPSITHFDPDSTWRKTP